MKNEKIRKEINRMTDELNNSLIRTFEHVDECEQEAYDRGLNECWKIFERFFLTGESDSLNITERGEIFGTISIANILRNFTPQQALEKIRAWEEKAEENVKNKDETEKIQIGDKVIVRFIQPSTNYQICLKGKVVANYPHKILILTKDKRLHEIDKLCGNLNIIRTEKHVDILGYIEE